MWLLSPANSAQVRVQTKTSNENAKGAPGLAFETWDPPSKGQSSPSQKPEGIGRVPLAPAYMGRKRWATRISCHREPPTSACAAFIKESRTDFADANKVYRKSGGSPTIAFAFCIRAEATQFGRPTKHRYTAQPPAPLAPKPHCASTLVRRKPLNMQPPTQEPGGPAK